jgi:broad specificity phosphatase PhoE/protein-L-isoaspartate O-methyltransferase
VTLVHFITHPEVTIDPGIPVRDWPLSPNGRRHMQLALDQAWVTGIRAIFSSAERKALDAAGILAEHLRVSPIVIDDLGENDRSATGYLPKAEFEAVADRFFASPEDSVRGWERAIDAQRRIIGAVERAIAGAPSGGDIAIVSHGGVGALLLCHLKNVPISRTEDQPGNGGGHVFSFDAASRRLLSGWRRIEDSRVALDRPSGTEGYAEEAPALTKQYESIAFADVHRHVMHLIPATPARILDIGAGTGRDAAGFAAMGHSVTAVEPTAELRRTAMTLHPSPLIEWLDDSLPDLALLHARGDSFDIVMLTAVWMHLDQQQRRRAMPRVASLVRDGGVMMLTLRHGPVPPGRRMFEVTAEETTRLAHEAGLMLLLQSEHRDGLLGRPGVSWTRMAFSRPSAKA